MDEITSIYRKEYNGNYLDCGELRCNMRVGLSDEKWTLNLCFATFYPIFKDFV